MIYLSYAKIPHDLSKDHLYNEVTSLFPHCENRSYIKKLYDKSDENSARESLFALVVLSTVISKFGIDAQTRSNLVFERNENGKPYFLDSHIKFNVSHSHMHVTCAVSDMGDIGIDIEQIINNLTRSERISKRFFTESEMRLVEQNPQCFTELWCKKEAFTKLCGMSLSEYMARAKKNHQATQEEFDMAVFHTLKWDEHLIVLCSTDSYESVNTFEFSPNHSEKS